MKQQLAKWLEKHGRMYVRLSWILFLGMLVATGLAMMLVPAGVIVDDALANVPPPVHALFITIEPPTAVPSAVLLVDGTDANGSLHVAGAIVDIEASPAAGWLFDHWEVDVTGTANPTQVTLDDDRYVTAVFVDNPDPTAQFSATPTLGDNPLTVSFTDESHPGTSAITSWAWDFDNDSVVDSTDQHPVHVYTAVGTYSVSLTVTNSTGTSTETKTDYIVVGPTAEFFWDKLKRVRIVRSPRSPGHTEFRLGERYDA